jgi:hypothetical protein
VKRLIHRIALAAVAGGMLLVAGCATITGSDTQAVMVATQEGSGEAVAGAECRLSNNNGAWTIKSPGAAQVRKSADDLLVRCDMEDRPPGTARVVSRMNAAMVGNVIFGGAVGVLIDHTRGTAYDYPQQVRIVFGRNRVVDGDDSILSTTSAPTAAPPPERRQQGGTQLDDLNGLLKTK